MTMGAGAMRVSVHQNVCVVLAHCVCYRDRVHVHDALRFLRIRGTALCA
jgi:hypothetical protein